MKNIFKYFKKIILTIFIITFIFINCGCIARNISKKGYILDENDLSKIKIGLTNKENTIKILGYPLMKSHFDENIWIYYSYEIKEVLFFKPILRKQKILLIDFDENANTIKEISLYDIDSNNYEILDIDVENKDKKENIIKDILSNIGQISM